MEQKELTVFNGSNLEFILPSGATAIISEHSAVHDDILTKGSTTRADYSTLVKNLNNYIVSLLQNNPYNPESKKKITLDEVKKLRLNDKYYIVFKSRLHSIGSELDIEHIFNGDEDKVKHEFEINLEEYDRDLSLSHEELAQLRDEEELCIERYKEGYEKTFFEVQLSSGKTVQLNYHTAEGELYVLEKMKRNEIVASTEILARRPKIKQDDEYLEIKNLNVFSKKDTIELKKAIKDNDLQWPFSIGLVDPATEKTEYLPLITVKDFFFPDEI